MRSWKQTFATPALLMWLWPSVNGCDYGGTQPIPLARPISLSARSITVARGGTNEVGITVQPEAFGVTLSVMGVPAGIKATFAPEFLGSGDATSVLKLSADSATALAEATLTVVARPSGAGAVATTAQLIVRVIECPGYVGPGGCPPFPTGGVNTISGTVTERTASGSRRAAGASVWAWVQLPNGNGYASGVDANADGVFTLQNLPDALIVLDARSQFYDQPCASIVNLRSATATANLEIVPSTKPVVEDAPSAPGITGVVYEHTPAGRQPLAGATVFFEFLFEIVAATTTTDENGRYSLCSLPTGKAVLTPVKTGYVVTGHPITMNESMKIDLEVKRQ